MKETTSLLAASVERKARILLNPCNSQNTRHRCLIFTSMESVSSTKTSIFLTDWENGMSWPDMDIVVKESASRSADPGFESCLRRGNFSGSSHTSDFKIGTPMATPSGVLHYRDSAGTGLFGVSILHLGETESLIWNLFLSMAARKVVWADPSPRYISMLLGH